MGVAFCAREITPDWTLAITSRIRYDRLTDADEILWFRLPEGSCTMIRCAALSALTVLLMLPMPVAAARNRDAQWKQVEEAISKQLPQTALERLKPIIQAALEEKAYPEALKAIQQKVNLQVQIAGNSPEERMALWDVEIAHAPRELMPIMHLIAAEAWHLQLFWKLEERESQRRERGGDTTQEEDIFDSDLSHAWREVDRHFQEALAADVELKKTPLSAYKAILDPDNNKTRQCCPSVFDFAAYSAIWFYARDDRRGPAPEDAFELRADSPIFAPAEEFVKWETRSRDSRSPTCKAIRLYQAVLGFHQNDSDKQAYMNADVERLKFGGRKAVGADRSTRYKAALKRDIDRCSDSVYSTFGRAELAKVLLAEDNLLEAHRVAEGGWKPEFRARTHSSWDCWRLLEEIESRSASIAVEQVWNEPWPSIRVRYRNLSKIYFRVIHEDWFAGQKNWALRGKFNGHPDVLAKEADLEWSVKLPATADFRARTEEISAPKNLKPGFYYLVASSDRNSKDKQAITEWTTFWVSDLAIVTKVQCGDGRVQGFVLDARSGEPIEGADAQAWVADLVRMTITAGPTTKTDRNGFFSLPAFSSLYMRTYIYARYQDQQLASAGAYSNSNGARKGDISDIGYRVKDIKGCDPPNTGIIGNMSNVRWRGEDVTIVMAGSSPLAAVQEEAHGLVASPLTPCR